MKLSRKLVMIGIALAAAVAAVLLFNLTEALPTLTRILITAGVVLAALGADYAIMQSGSAAAVSDAKKLKEPDDFIKAFEAWEYEETPFTEQIKMAARQIQSLKRKQAARRAVLDDSKDSPFASRA